MIDDDNDDNDDDDDNNFTMMSQGIKKNEETPNCLVLVNANE